MRILITGMNKQQCTYKYFLTSQLKVLSSNYSLYHCLQDMGHTVDQRPVVIGESLEEYDKVIVFLHNPSAFAAYVYNALWALHARADAIISFDDWQTKSIFDGVTGITTPEVLFRKHFIDSADLIPDNLTDSESAFMGALDSIRNHTYKILVPVFSGGDPSLLFDGEYPGEMIYGYNPNPYNFNRQPSGLFIEKERVFNFAGLIQDKTKKWLKNQKIDALSWPLELYGSKKDAQKRVTEDVMVNIYASQWGILMPKYHHAGSGWWRCRVLQVADAGSILIGDPEEMIIYYGDKELSSISASDLVGMSDTQLEETAQAQRDCLYKLHPLSKEVEQQEVIYCLGKE